MSCSFPSTLFTPHVQALFKEFDFFSLSTSQTLSFPNMSSFLSGNAGALSSIWPRALSLEGQGEWCRVMPLTMERGVAI